MKKLFVACIEQTRSINLPEGNYDSWADVVHHRLKELVPDQCPLRLRDASLGNVSSKAKISFYNWFPHPRDAGNFWAVNDDGVDQDRLNRNMLALIDDYMAFIERRLANAAMWGKILVDEEQLNRLKPPLPIQPGTPVNRLLNGCKVFINYFDARARFKFNQDREALELVYHWTTGDFFVPGSLIYRVSTMNPDDADPPGAYLLTTHNKLCIDAIRHISGRSECPKSIASICKPFFKQLYDLSGGSYARQSIIGIYQDDPKLLTYFERLPATLGVAIAKPDVTNESLNRRFISDCIDFIAIAENHPKLTIEQVTELFLNTRNGLASLPPLRDRHFKNFEQQTDDTLKIRNERYRTAIYQNLYNQYEIAKTQGVDEVGNERELLETYFPFLFEGRSQNVLLLSLLADERNNRQIMEVLRLPDRKAVKERIETINSQIKVGYQAMSEVSV